MNKEHKMGYFDNHPNIDTFYFTSDGYAFFTEHDAISHAKNLADKEVQTVTRLNMEDMQDLQDEDDELEYLDAE